jgi:hypothetical protein
MDLAAASADFPDNTLKLFDDQVEPLGQLNGTGDFRQFLTFIEKRIDPFQPGKTSEIMTRGSQPYSDFRPKQSIVFCCVLIYYRYQSLTH